MNKREEAKQYLINLITQDLTFTKHILKNPEYYKQALIYAKGDRNKVKKYYENLTLCYGKKTIKLKEIKTLKTIKRNKNIAPILKLKDKTKKQLSKKSKILSHKLEKKLNSILDLEERKVEDVNIIISLEEEYKQLQQDWNKNKDNYSTEERQQKENRLKELEIELRKKYNTEQEQRFQDNAKYNLFYEIDKTDKYRTENTKNMNELISFAKEIKREVLSMLRDETEAKHYNIEDQLIKIKIIETKTNILYKLINEESKLNNDKMKIQNQPLYRTKEIITILNEMQGNKDNRQDPIIEFNNTKDINDINSNIPDEDKEYLEEIVKARIN